MGRLGKTLIVWATVAFTAVDPASACRFGLFGRRCCPPRRCYSYCPPPCQPVGCCDGYVATSPPAYVSPSANPYPEYSAPAAPGRTAPAPLPSPAPLPAPSLVRPAPTPAPAPPADDFRTPFPSPDDNRRDSIPSAPSPPSRPSADVDDLFRDTDSRTSPTPSPPAKKADDVDDLFKDTQRAPAGERRLAASATAAELEDLFGEPTSASFRLWTDNTGRFQVRARLVVVGEKSVRLLKENGKFTTVSLERLSAPDLAFVRDQATSAIAGK
jgi:hypothetical protein